MGTLTDLFRSETPAKRKVINVFQPCDPEPPNNTATIRIYDPQGFIADEPELINTVDSVATYYNRILASAGKPFEFEAEYNSFQPTKIQINSLGRMDFPLYLFHSTGSSSISASQIKELMVEHRINRSVRMYRVDIDRNSSHSEGSGDLYDAMDSWETRPDVLGYGLPGQYHTEDGHNCHKLIIIKLDAMLSIDTPFANPHKFKWCLEHELGHVLSLHHCSDTHMEESYSTGFANVNFLFTQIDTIVDTLTKLSQINNIEV